MLEARLSPGTLIEPGNMLLCPNTYLMFHTLPDEIRVIADMTTAGRDTELTAILRVAEYDCGIKFGFPLGGSWLMKGTPETGILDHHRFGTSNEFGIDLLRIGGAGELFPDAGQIAQNHFGHGEKVLAAADGRVAAVNQNETQDWFRFNPQAGETADQFQQRQLSEVRAALQGDTVRWAAGNYVILEHREGVYSAYLHLKTHSPRVQAGEEVKRGHHIADVGNTGDSFGTHLHFQVIDRPDLARCRSLPFEFDKVEISLSEPGWFIKSVTD